MRLPKGDVACGCAPFVPNIQRLDDALGRAKDDERIYRLDAGDLVYGKLVPPGGYVLELPRNLFAQVLLVTGCGGAPDLRIKGPHPVHRRHEFVGPMVADAVFQRGKQTVMCIEAEDVPRIEDGPALDAPLEELGDLRQEVRRLGEPAARTSQLARRHQAVDLAEHSR